MASTHRLRVGFIGAGGRWGPSAHAPALQKVPEVELYAVCTAHADTAQAAAEKYGVKHAYGDVTAMGKDPQVEAALVAVRNHEKAARLQRHDRGRTRPAVEHQLAEVIAHAERVEDHLPAVCTGNRSRRPS